MHTAIRILEVIGIGAGIALAVLIVASVVFLSNPDNYR